MINNFNLDPNDPNSFAGPVWTNILANVVAIFFLLSTTVTIIYLVINLSIKAKINIEIKKLLKKDFLITNIEEKSFYSLIEYIKIHTKEELKKILKKKFISENQEKTNLIESQIFLFRNIFTNFHACQRLSKWNKAVEILRYHEAEKFKSIRDLTIALDEKELIFSYSIKEKTFKKTLRQGKLIELE
ncbi:MAG: hypothetical protein ACRDA7_01765 [Metamycoplasmataceae bacterium]